MPKHKITTLCFLIALFLLGMSVIFASMSIWYFVIVAVLWFFVAAAGSLYINSNYHIKTYCSNPDEKRNLIALTFDDGPNENTLLILDMLKKNETTAAFFCIGKNIEANPEIFKRIIADGHIVGNHSYSHSRLIDFFGKKRMIREITDTDRIIEKFSGRKPMFFRPPYGVTNPSIRRAIENTGHKVIGWNIRSLDGIISNSKIVYHRIIKRTAPGSIVLLHDTKPETVDVLARLLAYATQKNYKFVSVAQLLNLEAYEN